MNELEQYITELEQNFKSLDRDMRQKSQFIKNLNEKHGGCDSEGDEELIRYIREMAYSIYVHPKLCDSQKIDFFKRIGDNSSLVRYYLNRLQNPSPFGIPYK